MGSFIYQSRKNGSVIYSFLGKRGLIIYLAALKRGLFGPHIRTMSYIGSYPPPPPPEVAPPHRHGNGTKYRMGYGMQVTHVASLSKLRLHVTMTFEKCWSDARLASTPIILTLNWHILGRNHFETDIHECADLILACISVPVLKPECDRISNYSVIKSFKS